MTVALEVHRQRLWGLAYRMTGMAADADDIVQEAFVRALDRPPRDEQAVPFWLTRVTTRLAYDCLRRRKRTSYRGFWLPSPVADEEPVPSFELELGKGGGPHARYELLESASMAFLLALELLSPLQRAVLLLRDVYDFDVRETAAALDLSEANVKTTLHRARQKMKAYDEERFHPRDNGQAQATVERFMGALAVDDIDEIRALLAEGVRAYSDGGGRYLAANVPIVGREKAIKVFRHLHKDRGVPKHVHVVRSNGSVGVVLEYGPQPLPVAPRALVVCDLDVRGCLNRIYVQLVPEKLTRVLPGS